MDLFRYQLDIEGREKILYLRNERKEEENERTKERQKGRKKERKKKERKKEKKKERKKERKNQSILRLKIKKVRGFPSLDTIYFNSVYLKLDLRHNFSLGLPGP